LGEARPSDEKEKWEQHGLRDSTHDPPPLLPGETAGGASRSRRSSGPDTVAGCSPSLRDFVRAPTSPFIRRWEVVVATPVFVLNQLE
jgi:hypothetical protein